MLGTVWKWLTGPSDPEKYLSGTDLIVYRQGFEAAEKDEEYHNPHPTSSRFHKIYKTGYRNGELWEMSIY